MVLCRRCGRNGKLTPDTIFALASGAGKAAIAVIRISGPATATVIAALTNRAPPAPRQALLRRFHDADGSIIDQGLVLYFPGPASFTGEECAEFHCHGSLAVIDALLRRLVGMPGCRPAEPGEFTRRAFDHGRLDLTGVEGLADLIEAETEAQRRQAIAQLSGSLRALYGGWREALLQALAELEAVIDFADEDLPSDLEQRAVAAVTPIIEAIDTHLTDSAWGEKIRDGLRIVLVGAPNAGKSSLLNRLSGEEAAIVTDRPGTTRDAIRLRMVIGGLPVTMIDTAGLRATRDAVEQEGVRRALDHGRSADIILFLRDGRSGLDEPVGLDGVEEDDPRLLRVANMADLTGQSVEPAGAEWLAVSSLTGQGLDTLCCAIERKLVALAPQMSAVPVLSRRRHRQGVEQTQGHLGRFLTMIETDPVLACEDLRLAARSLGQIIGQHDVEDILDRIFGEFCIGK